jgi:hypothetical protein
MHRDTVPLTGKSLCACGYVHIVTICTYHVYHNPYQKRRLGEDFQHMCQTKTSWAYYTKRSHKLTRQDHLEDTVKGKVVHTSFNLVIVP